MSLYSTQLLQTPAAHRSGLASAIDSAWSWFNESLVQTTFSPLPTLARKVVLDGLRRITQGHLRLTTANEEYSFGELQASCPFHAQIVVKSESFWTRIILSKDLGFAEAYMFGEFDCDDMPALLRIIISNRDVLRMETLASAIFTKSQVLTAWRFLADLSTSQANASAHYDLGNELFSSFLSEDMNYSSAIFRNFKGDLEGEPPLESLEDAQTRKMLNIIKNARIQPGQKVLEVGSGWGALAILAARTAGCYVETLTLSVYQQQLATQRIKEAGLSDRITVHLMDYRDVRRNPEWEHSFDRFISVEMIENVGKEFIPTFWEVVDWALKPKEAIGVVQVISLAEARVQDYDKGVDFIQKWVWNLFFPGCYIPSCHYLIHSMNTGSKGRLTTDNVSNIGPHYARTLREWKRKFLRNFDSMIVPALQDKYQLGPQDIIIFKRKWTYYFDYCEAGFAAKNLGDHVITFTRDGNEGFGCSFDVVS